MWSVWMFCNNLLYIKNVWVFKSFWLISNHFWLFYWFSVFLSYKWLIVYQVFVLLIYLQATINLFFQTFHWIITSSNRKSNSFIIVIKVFKDKVSDFIDWNFFIALAVFRIYIDIYVEKKRSYRDKKYSMKIEMISNI